MRNTEIKLDGLWRAGFSKELKKPATDFFSVVPGSINAMPEFYASFGYAVFEREVSIGGMVRLRLTAGLHVRVFWDGKLVGASELGWTREEFDFDAGADTIHTLTIYTDNIMSHEPSSVFKPYYDFFAFNGISDSVTIERLVPGLLDRIDVIPAPDQPGHVVIRLHAIEPHPAELQISFDDKPLSRYPWRDELLLPVPDWHYWSPEEPYLHTVTVNGQKTDFGIRYLDWSGRRLKLNGKEIKLFGVNRHESHPQFGAATPESLILNDLISIKRQGFNFIRGAHYPQREFMLSCADLLGLLVWEEALGWGNPAAELQNEVFMTRQEEQCRKMVRKSINHPSVIIWGFLNECESTSADAVEPVLRLRDLLHVLDPTRPATFATFRIFSDKCIEAMDIIAINTYPDWYDKNDSPCDYDAITRRLNDLAAHYTAKPILISEIGCGTIYGDHNGLRWSEEYQEGYITRVLENIRDMPDFSGVALWQFCDTRTHITTDRITGVPRCFNNKGLLNEYRQPKLAWRAAGRVLKSH